MSIVDSVIISAIIGSTTVIGGYVYSRKKDREIELFKLKKEKYEDLIKLLATQIHLVQTMGGKTTSETHEKMDIILNTLWLYGSDDVMRYLNSSIAEAEKQNTNYLNKILYAMRKDLRNTNLKESEVVWYRST
jgi:hypothetical protein